MTNPSEAVEPVAYWYMSYGQEFIVKASEPHPPHALPLVFARADHPPQAEGEALGSSAAPIPTCSPAFARLVLPSVYTALDCIVSPTSGIAQERLEYVVSILEKARDAQQAAPAGDTTAGYGAEGVVDHPAPQQGVEAVREALKPFLDAAENMGGDEPDTMSLWESPEAMMLTFGDLRRIAALRPSPDSKDGTDG